MGKRILQGRNNKNIRNSEFMVSRNLKKKTGGDRLKEFQDTGGQCMGSTWEALQKLGKGHKSD